MPCDVPPNAPIPITWYPTSILALIFQETRNLVFMGSNVLEGEGTGIVVQTGNNSVVGKITEMAIGSNGTTQPAIKDINRFVLFIVSIALSTGAIIVILFFAWLNQDYYGFLTVSGKMAPKFYLISKG